MYSSGALILQPTACRRSAFFGLLLVVLRPKLSSRRLPADVIISTSLHLLYLFQEISKPPPSPVKPYEANAIQSNTIESTNHSKPSVTPTNHKTPETHQPDSASQRHEMQTRSLELANQREAVKMMSQDMVHYNQVYAQPFHGEEVRSKIDLTTAVAWLLWLGHFASRNCHEIKS